eukprot:1158819-Pelagomonas_calceolata.AAC.4
MACVHVTGLACIQKSEKVHTARCAEAAHSSIANCCFDAPQNLVHNAIMAQKNPMRAHVQASKAQRGKRSKQCLHLSTSCSFIKNCSYHAPQVLVHNAIMAKMHHTRARVQASKPQMSEQYLHLCPGAQCHHGKKAPHACACASQQGTKEQAISSPMHFMSLH